jgi:anti-sigma regulatory factor (Ser/Thr protein kinase)
VDEVIMNEPLPGPDLSTALVADRAQLHIPSQIEWISPILEFLRQRLLLVRACDEAQAQRLVLGLHEGLTNAIIHGNLEIPSTLKEEGDAFTRLLAERLDDPRYRHRTVSVGVDYDGHRCQWVITDEGPGFDVEKVLEHLEDPENGLLASGRGILMMRAFFDEVRWEAGGRRLILTWSHPQTRENRKHPRWPVHRKIQVAPIRPDGSVDWSAASEAVTRNLSSGGALVLHQTLARAERVMLTLDVDGQPLHLPAQVRRCTPLAEGVIELGCCFQTEVVPEQAPATGRLTEAIDSLLVQVQEQHPGQDRRRHPRVDYAERVEVLATEDRPAISGFAQDLSRGGMKFITTQEIPCEIRTIELPQIGGSRLRVRVQVVRCLRITDLFYDVAVRFLDTE